MMSLLVVVHTMMLLLLLVVLIVALGFTVVLALMILRAVFGVVVDWFQSKF
jgi:hypothetical protein